MPRVASKGHEAEE